MPMAAAACSDAAGDPDRLGCPRRRVATRRIASWRGSTYGAGLAPASAMLHASQSASSSGGGASCSGWSGHCRASKIRLAERISARLIAPSRRMQVVDAGFARRVSRRPLRAPPAMHGAAPRPAKQTPAGMPQIDAG